MPLAVQEQAGPAFAVKPAESPELPVENGRVAAISRQGSLMGSPSSSLASAAGSRVCMETSSRIFKGGCPSCLQLSLPEMYHGCAETSSLNAADAQQPIRAVLRHQVLAADAQEVGHAGMPVRELRLENLLDAPYSWMPRLEITRLMLGRCD